nr:NmrA family NAD(P)-binding protein [Glycomyces arizonensis]
MILVTGATGSTGRYLVRQLKERGTAFRALVRDRAKGEALGAIPAQGDRTANDRIPTDHGANRRAEGGHAVSEYAIGDFDDPASLAAAMVGVDRVFLASPGAQAVEGEQPMIRWERNVIDAAKDAGVQYIVKLSIWNAAPGRPMSEGGHGVTETYLKSSGIAWTMLQPGGFMQNFLTPTAGLTDEHGNLIGPVGEAPVAFVDTYDLAAAAAALLTEAPRPGESYVITGPEALAYREIAAKLSMGRGHHVGFVGETSEAIAKRLRGFGLPEGPAHELASLYDTLGAGAYSETTDAVERLTGIAPRSFDQFMAANAEAFPALAEAKGWTVTARYALGTPFGVAAGDPDEPVERRGILPDLHDRAIDALPGRLVIGVLPVESGQHLDELGFEPVVLSRGPCQVPAVDGDLIERHQTHGLSGEKVTPPAVASPSQAFGSAHASASTASLRGSCVRHSGITSGAGAGGGASVSGLRSFCAALVNAPARPSAWLSIAPTVYSSHGVGPDSMPSSMPSSSAVIRSVTGLKSITDGVMRFSLPALRAVRCPMTITTSFGSEIHRCSVRRFISEPQLRPSRRNRSVARRAGRAHRTVGIRDRMAKRDHTRGSRKCL